MNKQELEEVSMSSVVEVWGGLAGYRVLRLDASGKKGDTGAAHAKVCGLLRIYELYYTLRIQKILPQTSNCAEILSI